MAINCEQVKDKTLIYEENEYFVKEASNVVGLIEINDLDTFHGEGKLILTTSKIVFINYEESYMRSFSAKLSSTFEESYCEPKRSKSIKGKVIIRYGQHRCICNFSFIFYDKADSSIISLWFSLLDQTKSSFSEPQQPSEENKQPDSSPENSLQAYSKFAKFRQSM